MKTQFVKLFLLILATLLFVALVSQTLMDDEQDQYHTEVNIGEVFAALQLEPGQPGALNSVQLLAIDDLRWSENLLQDLKAGKVVSLQESEQHVLFYQLSRSDSNQVIQLGPFTQNPQASPFEPVALLFYLSFSLLLFLWVWPMFRDLEQLGRASRQFSRSREPVSLKLKSSSRIYPLARDFQQMSAQIMRYMSLQRFLSSTLSHDIRTPVSRINFCIEMLNANNIDKMKSSILEDLDEIEKLTHDFIEFSKLEEEQQNLEIKHADVVKTLEGLSEKLSLDTSVHIELQVPENLFFRHDSKFLRRALQNVMCNAVKYAQSRVCVSVMLQQERVLLVVEDDGEGIEDEERGQILAPFARGKSAQDVGNGYGLGLAFAKVICEWHRGSLSIEHSNNFGGTKILFNLPV